MYAIRSYYVIYIKTEVILNIGKGKNMDIFTQEHKDIREKNGTTKQVEYYLNTIARDEIDDSLALFLESLIV